MEKCETLEDFKRLDTQLVQLVGTYQRGDPLDFRKKQVRREGEPPSRRVWIRLKDGPRILIGTFWAKEERPEEEIAALGGKIVIVTGRILGVESQQDDGHMQTMVVPAICDVTDIRMHE